MSDSRTRPSHADIVARKGEGTEAAPAPNLPETHQGQSRSEGLHLGLALRSPYARPPLASFLNGRLAARPFEETRELYHGCIYGWLQPLDLYLWSIAGYTGRAVVCDQVRRPDRRFGLFMHARGTRKVTIEALKELERVKQMKKNTFQARAARFNVIFGELPEELRPFFYYEFEDLRGFKHPAYQMRSGRDYILVTGPADETREDTIDWEYFLTPPKRAGSRAAK